MKDIKCVLIGDGAVGKTSLNVTYATGSFPIEYVPTVYDKLTVNIMYEDKSIRLHIYDIAGVEEPDVKLGYYIPKTDVFIFCFSLVCPDSLNGVINCWQPKIIEKCPGVPYILAGLKSDLRDDLIKNKISDDSGYIKPIPTSQGEKAKIEINALDYIECSSLNKYNLNEVFMSAIEQTFNGRENRSSNDSKKTENVCCQIY